MKAVYSSMFLMSVAEAHQVSSFVQPKWNLFSWQKKKPKKAEPSTLNNSQALKLNESEDIVLFGKSYSGDEFLDSHGPWFGKPKSEVYQNKSREECRVVGKNTLQNYGVSWIRVRTDLPETHLFRSDESWGGAYRAAQSMTLQALKNSFSFGQRDMGYIESLPFFQDATGGALSLSQMFLGGVKKGDMIALKPNASLRISNHDLFNFFEHDYPAEEAKVIRNLKADHYVPLLTVTVSDDPSSDQKIFVDPISFDFKDEGANRRRIVEENEKNDQIMKMLDKAQAAMMPPPQNQKSFFVYPSDLKEFDSLQVQSTTLVEATNKMTEAFREMKGPNAVSFAGFSSYVGTDVAEMNSLMGNNAQSFQFKGATFAKTVLQAIGIISVGDVGDRKQYGMDFFSHSDEQSWAHNLRKDQLQQLELFFRGNKDSSKGHRTILKVMFSTQAKRDDDSFVMFFNDEQEFLSTNANSTEWKTMVPDESNHGELKCTDDNRTVNSIEDLKKMKAPRVKILWSSAKGLLVHVPVDLSKIDKQDILPYLDMEGSVGLIGRAKDGKPRHVVGHQGQNLLSLNPNVPQKYSTDTADFLSPEKDDIELFPVAELHDDVVFGFYIHDQIKLQAFLKNLQGDRFLRSIKLDVSDVMQAVIDSRNESFIGIKSNAKKLLRNKAQDLFFDKMSIRKPETLIVEWFKQPKNIKKYPKALDQLKFLEQNANTKVSCGNATGDLTNYLTSKGKKKGLLGAATYRHINTIVKIEGAQTRLMEFVNANATVLHEMVILQGSHNSTTATIEVDPLSDISNVVDVESDQVNVDQSTVFMPKMKDQENPVGHKVLDGTQVGGNSKSTLSI